MRKLLIICGLTATGKTGLGIRLAKKFSGEIVSADSRQVYKGMDILTGKDIDQNSQFEVKNKELGVENEKLTVGYRLKDGIPIWLVDIVDPTYPFSAGEYGILAKKVIQDIWSREKLPIVVGGSGLYIRAITDPLDTNLIPPDKVLRKEMEDVDIATLQKLLIETDKKKWEMLNNSDRQNPRRLIRKIEISHWEQNRLKKAPVLEVKPESTLLIGLKTSLKYIYPYIDHRVEDRIREGVVKEVKDLMSKKYSFHLPAMTTTGIASLKEYILGKESWDTAVKGWKFQEHHYAGRQFVWFKKIKNLEWFNITDKDFKEKIEKRVGAWYADKN